MIPLFDASGQYEQLKSEIDAAVAAVLAGGQYILGPNVRAFEREIADYLGCKHAIGVANGTDALHLALRALDIGPGDEVITTPFTFIASTEAIGLVGATPVFVDVDPHTFNLDASRIESAITRRTKAILPVHLFGQPCDMDAILAVAKRYAIHVVEDCAQAIGAKFRDRRVGTLGDIGCFSFFPTKNLGCCGDGGLVITSDERLAGRVDLLRRHGGQTKYHHQELGINSRLDELQASILRIKLPHLDCWNNLRKEHAYRYNELLASCPSIVRPAEQTSGSPIVPTSVSKANSLVCSVYHQYTLLIDDRDAVQKALHADNIGNATYYPVPMHLQQAHADLGYQPGDMPNAEALSKTCLSLPMFPELTEIQLRAVSEAVLRNVSRHRPRIENISGRRRRAVNLSLPAGRTFSLNNYKSLLNEFLSTGYQFIDFRQAGCARSLNQPFVLLRHDVDMELERALNIAEVEAGLGIRSTFFVLLRTELYNVLSKHNSDCVRRILELGHELGLHFDCASYDDVDDATLARLVKREAALLGDWFDREISIVSFHRPTEQTLSRDKGITFPLEHAYLPKFAKQIHYCSDSGGEFRYGHPLDSPAFLSKLPMQLLIHPIWWSETASSAAEELHQLVARRQERYLRSLADNCKVFPRPRRMASA